MNNSSNNTIIISIEQGIPRVLLSGREPQLRFIVIDHDTDGMTEDDPSVYTVHEDGTIVPGMDPDPAAGETVFIFECDRDFVAEDFRQAVLGAFNGLP